jgi:hypothetical protein
LNPLIKSSFLSSFGPTVPHNVYVTGVYLTDAYLMGIYLINVHLTGVHLMGVYLMGVCHTGVHLTGGQINARTFDKRRGSRAPARLQGASEVPRGRHSYVRQNIRTLCTLISYVQKSVE